MQIFGSQPTPVVATAASDVVSLMVLVEGMLEPANFWARSIVAPDKTTIWDLAAFQKTGLVAPVFFQNGDPLTILLPASPDLPVAAGDYLLGLINYTGVTEANVSVMTRVGGEPTTPTLDVVHHFVSLPDLNAATAPSDPDFVAYEQAYAEALALVGITLGTVSYEDVNSEALSSIDSTEGPDSEFAELMTLAPDGRALHVFYVEQISDPTLADGYVLGGLAGGTPGPATVGGTRASGVGISTLDLRTAPRFKAFSAAHETLHFLGLFHTTEADGQVLEPISDTPSCPIENDTDSDGLLSYQECAALDGNNIMFWISDGSRTEITATAGQRYVVMRNPLLRTGE